LNADSSKETEINEPIPTAIDPSVKVYSKSFCDLILTAGEKAGRHQRIKTGDNNPATYYLSIETRRI